ncbi:hypothetical protein FHS18_002043 [Paenibacillus phyllosphaerae]|uniref:Uncharacterized protein n=1 Tax=Paenibacillus phyllosphaerae TaxID=274593 RepID=A0A7W5AWA9_9BACL|nr:PCYCGC motif-containing (lipo)protein [Paenibacillus phyllosphaerae]MBB3109980.1 hypothetical protein [Paenibacillus phyllosphaerae]
MKRLTREADRQPEAQSRRSAVKWLVSLSALTISAVVVLSACSSSGDSKQHQHGSELFETTESFAVAPSFLTDYSKLTQDLYAQVGSVAEILKEINCYCGCMDDAERKHDSLYRCYIGETDEDSITWTNHSASCGICMEELEDIIEMNKAGKTTDEIRDAIDAKFKPSI